MIDHRCPGCGHKLNAATEVGGGEAQPRTGDLSACLYCGAGLLFVDDGGGVRLLMQHEIEALPPDEKQILSSAMAVAAIYRAKFGKKVEKK